jgi:putative membrane protein
MNPLVIPPFNAALNGLSTILIGSGFVAIKRRKIAAHRAIMLSAAASSALFLVGYVTYHVMEAQLHRGPTPFGGTGIIRPIYFAMLISHILLAFAIAFLVPRTFYLALKGRYEDHRRWARVTFPIWFYVSITGVLVYFFLYQWWPSPNL